MSEVIDLSELNQLSKDLYDMGLKFPRKQKKFLEEKGHQLLVNTVSESKHHSKRINKMVKRSTKRGKVYKRNKASAIRVYSPEPHMHLIENGHRMVTHDGQEVGFVPGKHIFEKSAKKFEPYFVREVEKMIDKEYEKW